ncbi:MAG: hypothetical protein PUI78_07270 [Treponema sp.]|nr:hypothetical protein [Treponema sp.]
MKKVEIILTQAIEGDFIAKYEIVCKREKVPCKYTKVDGVMGQGNTCPKLGDPIWPQLNVLFLIYCEDSFTEKIAEIMRELHKEYPGEGAASFVSDAGILV